MEKQGAAQQTGKKKTLSKDTIQMIASIAAQCAVEKYAQEREAHRQQLRDKRFRNTKLLIRKYRQLRDYESNAIYTTAQLLGDGTDEVLAMLGIDSEDRYEVGRIRDNVAVTKVIMDHVDEMLSVFQRRCEKSHKPEAKRRWRILYAMYLSEDQQTAQEIADRENICERTLYQDIDLACEDLTSLFFGLDLHQFME